MMKRMVTAIAGAAMLAFIATMFAQAAEPAAAETKAKAKKPADRVVVMYFHRTQRCPTCLRMGTYTEEAMASGFAKEMKKGTVEFHFVDFQDPRNEALVKGYKIGGPTLIVVKVVDNKAVAARNLTQIWTKNREKSDFLKYVQDNVVVSQKPLPKKTAKKPQDQTSA